MGKTVAGLIQHCKDKLGTPYVFGAKGQIMTQSLINQLARENQGTYTATYKAKAARFIGKACTDCSGLISWYTGRIRGSWDYHDSATKSVDISRLDESMVGWALWKPGHIGIYIGGGYCIEAKGIDYGTIKSKVSATAWQKVLKLCDIDYTAAVDQHKCILDLSISLPSLVRGHECGYVKTLQRLLVARGYGTNGIDGIFGVGTEKAVTAFQKDAGVKVNFPGTVGSKTWEALLKG